MLDLCYAYLLLGSRLLTGADTDCGAGHASAWNFGPAREAEIPVRELVLRFLGSWGRPDFPVEVGFSVNYEATTLRHDASRAASLLGWRPGLAVGDTALVSDQIGRFEEILGLRAATPA